MRNLVIKREKSFVGFLGKFKVYIVDPNSNDLKINKQSCRKLGTLKNGQEVVFQIPNEEVKIYIIADKFTKSFCNEFVVIPAGETDAYLLGKCKYSPFMGNPFRLEGQVSEETKLNRKSGRKKALKFFLTWGLIGFVFGFCLGYFGDNSDEPETFVVNEMQITLLDSFYQLDVDGYGATFSSEEVSVFAFKNYIPSEKEYQDMTLQEYGVLSANFIEENYFNKYGGNCSDFKSENGFNYIEYQINNEDGSVYYYKEYLYEVSDGFWSVRFVCSTEEAYVANYNSFDEWASSVTFTESV